jgi:hypothetical protein
LNDPVKRDRFLRMMSFVSLVMVAALLPAFPDFWWQMWQANRFLCVFMIGAIFPTSMLVVGIGWCLMHLAGYLTALGRRDPKSALASSTGGVWDRELD